MFFLQNILTSSSPSRETRNGRGASAVPRFADLGVTYTDRSLWRSLTAPDRRTPAIYCLQDDLLTSLLRGLPSPTIEYLLLGIYRVGLRSSDDQRTYFDLRAELLKNGTRIACGETRNIQGVTHNPDKAKEVVLDFGPISDRYFNSGNILSLRILTKVTATGGNNSAVGLRLYYDAVSRASRIEPSSIPSCVDLGNTEVTTQVSRPVSI